MADDELVWNVGQVAVRFRGVDRPGEVRRSSTVKTRCVGRQEEG